MYGLECQRDQLRKELPDWLCSFEDNASAWGTEGGGEVKTREGDGILERHLQNQLLLPRCPDDPTSNSNPKDAQQDPEEQINQPVDWKEHQRDSGCQI